MRRITLTLLLLGSALACGKVGPAVPRTVAAPDADEDGIADLYDACPTDKEDDHGARRRDGCPDDTDGDGVLGSADKCADKPETVNQFEDGDGCPDTAPAPSRQPVAVAVKVKPTRVTVTESEIVIEEKIHFATGLARIEPDSNELLDQVADSLKDNPDVDYVEIAGHADVRGSAQQNLGLTRSRAEAVRAALMARGVDHKRLRAAGYGAYCPLDSGNHEEAWTKNRRVAFHILRRAGRDLDVRWGGCPQAQEHGMSVAAIPDDAPRSVPAATPERVATERVPEPEPLAPSDPLATEDAACRGGDAIACMSIGLALEGGTGFAPDLVRSKAAYQRACEAKHQPGCGRLGEREMIDDKAAAAAKAHWSEACEGGDGAGCERLGWQLETGAGVPKDLAQAVVHYETSCRASHAPGCAAWGRLTYEGRGIEQNTTFGLALLDHACSRHWQPACDLHAKLPRGSVEAPAPKADVKVEVAAKVKPRAKVEVALPVCLATTPDACKTACEGGDGKACRVLGTMTAYGIAGLQADAKLAVDLYGKAVALGDVRAHVHLGFLFESGTGVKIDLPKAAAGFRSACDASDLLGCVHLGRLELAGRGVAKNEAHGRARFAAACDAGEARGCLELGIAYELGRGSAVDLGLARAAYDKGCERGDVAACGAWGSVTVRTSTTVDIRNSGMGKLKWACGKHNAKSCQEMKRLAVCELGDIAACKARCDKGDAATCALLGGFYAEGKWVAQSDREAHRYFAAAYEASLAISCGARK